MTYTKADQRLFTLTRWANALVVLGLGAAGIVSFQFVASPQVDKGGPVFTGLTVWLLLSGMVAIVLGIKAMKRTRVSSVERVRSWYAIAFGLVALSMGATFGVGFV